MPEDITFSKATNTAGNSFVGFKIEDGQAFIFYPEAFRLSSKKEDKQKDILLLLKTISLAKNRPEYLSSYLRSGTSEGEKSFPFDAYFYLISDYFGSGRYSPKEKTWSVSGDGKINWKKTTEQNPILTQGGFVFTNVFKELSKDKHDILYEAYRYCVEQSIEMIGWLYGIPSTFSPILSKKSAYLRAINTALQHTFNSKDKVRLFSMREVLLGVSGRIKDVKRLRYGVDTYDYVFERLVDHAFGNVDDISAFYPQSSWVIGEKETPSTFLRPDSAAVTGDKVLIIDAKYYRFGTTGSISDLPDTTSIEKQITYGDYVRNFLQEKKQVQSVFVLPCLASDKGPLIQKFGYAKANWQVEEGQEKIPAVLVDLRSLIFAFEKEKSSLLPDLLKSL